MEKEKQTQARDLFLSDRALTGRDFRHRRRIHKNTLPLDETKQLETHKRCGAARTLSHPGAAIHTAPGPQ